jgi:homoserine kinase
VYWQTSSEYHIIRVEMEREITAFAPASVSNVACGFDIMGFALDQPGDIVTARIVKSSGVHIKSITGETSSLPTDPALNTAAAPVVALLRHCGTKLGVELEISKGVPVGGGIGSSAASAVAAAVACNALLELHLTKEELLPFAIEGEKIASDAVHVDNLSPSLWGGFILVRGYKPIDIVQIEAPRDLWCTIIHPHIEIQTKASRKLLPKSVPLADLVTQTGNAAGLVAGLLKQDYALIGRSLHDVVAEPARSHTIPGFANMKAGALDAGALGCSISGSGPSVFALSATKETAVKVGASMKMVLDSLACPHTVFVSRICSNGARIIS